MRYSLIVFLSFFLNGIVADRVLLLVDKAKVKQSHSIFIKLLEERGHAVTIKMADDPSLELIKYGEHLYEHLILLAPTVDEFGGSLNVAEIIKFVDGGGNLLIAGGPIIGDSIRDLATEVGFEFDEDKTEVIDNSSYDTTLDQGQHTTVVASGERMIDAELIAGQRSTVGPIIFRGTALVADASNKLLLKVVTAESTAYSFNPTTPVDEKSTVVGNNIVLVGAMQARNNARVVITGSLDLLSDAFINANVQKAAGKTGVKSGNGALATALSKWVLKEAGVLRVKSVRHHVVGASKPPAEYTIMENVYYEIDIEEKKDGKWVPFQGKDVQLEFVRIDPFVRSTLQNKNGKLSTTFKVPDVYGVYKFLIDYRRIGYTHLFDVQQVSVRPLQHTQYERFSRCAWPYYVSAFSMMIGMYLFSFIFLYHKDVAGSTSGAALDASLKKTVKNK